MEQTQKTKAQRVSETSVTDLKDHARTEETEELLKDSDDLLSEIDDLVGDEYVSDNLRNTIEEADEAGFDVFVVRNTRGQIYGFSIGLPCVC